MIDKNSMVLSSRTLVEDHYEFKEVQCTRKRIRTLGKDQGEE
jgi:hypothetical protein